MAESRAIAQYLQRHAEREAAQARRLVPATGQYDNSLGVPVFNEDAGFVETLHPVMHSPTLLVLVVNQPVGGPASEANQQFLQHLQASATAVTARENLQLYRYSDRCDILLVDRFNHGLQIPSAQGVGLARKIAADIALALHTAAHIKSPWLCGTDADAQLPADYFSRLPAGRDAGAAACLFPFRHVAEESCDAQTLRFTRLYEKRLHYFVAGLQFAGSQHAYHALGSTICSHARYYAEVRGYPPRNAGEDFYLLNKLAKTGSIISLAGTPVLLRARQSNRTPFGTGASVARLCSSAAAAEHRIFYHPGLFVCLRALLAWQRALAAMQFVDRPAQSLAGELLPAVQGWQASLQQFLAQQDLSQQLEVLSHPQTQAPDAVTTGVAMAAALEQLGFSRAIVHCSAQARSAGAYHRHLQNWFDGFRSLRWLHELRERMPGFADIDEACAEDLWTKMRSHKTKRALP